MLRLLFFASIRERLGRANLSLEYGEDVARVHELVQTLDRRELPGCAEILLADNILVAVNRDVVPRKHPLRDGDEVAFYPPVTGG